MDCSLHGGGGHAGLLGLETVEGLRDLRLAATHRAEAGDVPEPRHHGLLADCGQEDEDTLRLTQEISLLSSGLVNLLPGGWEDPALFDWCRSLHSPHDSRHH